MSLILEELGHRTLDGLHDYHIQNCGASRDFFERCASIFKNWVHVDAIESEAIVAVVTPGHEMISNADTVYMDVIRYRRPEESDKGSGLHVVYFDEFLVRDWYDDSTCRGDQ